MKTPIKLRDLKGTRGEIRFDNVLVASGQYPVHTLYYHRGIHWDEIIADFIIREYGDTCFRGVSQATAKYMERNQLPTASFEALKNGILMIGCGDSPFNEHEALSRGEVSGQCAATLVANLIGVANRPELRKLLADAFASDREPQQDVGHIHNIIKAMKASGVSDEEVSVWATQAVRAVYTNQLDYWQGAAESFKDFGRVEEMQSESGRKWRVAIISADEEVYTKYALSPKGKDAAVAIAANSQGQISVLTQRPRDDSSDLRRWFLPELFRILAMKHLIAMKQQVPVGYQSERANIPDDVGGLHFWREGGGILNKGMPIGVPLGEVVAVVRGMFGRFRDNYRPHPNHHSERRDPRRSLRQDRPISVTVPVPVQTTSDMPGVSDGMVALGEVLDKVAQDL